MGIRYKFSAQFFKQLLLKAVLLVLVRNSTQVLDNDNAFELSISNQSEMITARKDATRILEEPQLTYPGRLFEIGWRITGMNPEELKRAKDVNRLSREGSESSTPKKLNLLGEEMSEHDRTRDDRFEYQVYKPLLRCLQDSHTVDLTSQAEHVLLGLIDIMAKELRNVYTRLPLNVAEHSEHVSSVRTPRTNPMVADGDRLALSTHHLTSPNNALKSSQDNFAELFLKNTQSALKLLSDSNNFNHTPPKASLSMAFRLSDIFMRLLATLEKYNLITTDYLSWIINEETKGHVINNYILSYYPTHSDVAGICLNYYDFKRSVEMSSFTQEIHDLIRFIKPETWYNLERSHLMLLSTHTDSSVKVIVANFARITSPDPLNRANKAVLGEMTKQLLNDHTFKHDTEIRKPNDLINLLILHKMISFLIKHHVSAETMSQIKESIFLQAVDEATNLLHYSLKTVYIEYGKLLKAIAGMHPTIDSKVILNREIRKYMIDSGQNSEVTTTSLEKPESSEWRYPNEQVWLNFLEYSKAFDVDHERSNGLETSPVVVVLKEASRHIVKQIGRLDSHSSFNKQRNPNIYIKFKILLEELLSP